MNILNNYNVICNNINSIKNINLVKNINIIIVSKTITIEKIQPLINVQHIHFGENKFQEAKSKWLMTKKNYPNIKLHFLGKLQSNNSINSNVALIFFAVLVTILVFVINEDGAGQVNNIYLILVFFLRNLFG